MKKMNLAFVFAALLGMAPLAKPASIPGNWTLHYDWNCTGSYGTLAMSLASGGTWSGGGLSGNWAVIGGTPGTTSSDAGMLTFNFSSAKTVYSGVLASKTVTGTQSTFGGLNGCFFMEAAGAPSSSVSEQAATDERAPNKPEDAAGDR
ncbi:MAG: hypothetical protein JO097_02810 [Acidobacteriaceae bacterium]|nr:hypothetical protein [Acidobacteriaceae bacterium]MBV9765406.1 hypothetical protein [Acidobacteriaceae bacterium]